MALPLAERTVGRYEIFGQIATGGMAAVHYGRLLAAAGFSKTVAIKRLHAHYAADERFVEMFVNEARLAGRIRHPNVVQTLDVVVNGDDVLLVMEYVHGLPLSAIATLLARRRERMPLPIMLAIFSNVLLGLHAAHGAVGEQGESLEIVHRDVSPQNVIVDVDGTARVLDFGIAKAVSVSQTSGEMMRGKAAYMAPEQILPGRQVSRRTDVYAVGVVLWEMLVGERLFSASEPGHVYFLVANGAVRAPSSVDPSVPSDLEAIILRALLSNPEERFGTALEMAMALQSCGRVATPLEVSEWLRRVGEDALSDRSARLARVEQGIEEPSEISGPQMPDIRGGYHRHGLHPGERTEVVLEDVPASVTSGRSPTMTDGWRGRRGRAITVALLATGALLTAVLVGRCSVGRPSSQPTTSVALAVSSTPAGAEPSSSSQANGAATLGAGGSSAATRSSASPSDSSSTAKPASLGTKRGGRPPARPGGRKNPLDKNGLVPWE
jgi:serine/threonine-protein kinase